MIYEVEVEFYKNLLTVDGNRIMIGLKSKPQKGKANRELIRKLAKHFNISTSQIRIIAGHKSKRKTIDIELNDNE